jgi:hypothetical protein
MREDMYLRLAKQTLAIMVVFGLALGPFNVQAQSEQAGTFKFYGEYGLYIHDRNDSLFVHWMTMAEDSGYLKVRYREDILHNFHTAPAKIHKSVFKNPGKKQLVLEYGSIQNENDKNRTVIFPKQKARPEKSRFSKADSIFVVGDVHGRFDELVQLLQSARVIDADLHWTGGKAHLAMLGDLFDRGHDVTRLLWFLYGLEREARQKKGYVHIVLGNHEIMTMANDLRYLSGKENLIASSYGTTYDKLFDVKESLLGRWLGNKPAIIKIDKALLAHGGVTPNYAHYPLDAYIDSLFAFLREPVFRDLMGDSTVEARYDAVYFENRLRFFFGSLSPFWFRGYVQTDTLGAFLDGVLKRYGTKVHVVAHTPVPTITELYDGKLIAVDLHNAATEMLLLVKDGRKYKRFKYDLAGNVVEL